MTIKRYAIYKIQQLNNKNKNNNHSVAKSLTRLYTKTQMAKHKNAKHAANLNDPRDGGKKDHDKIK